MHQDELADQAGAARQKFGSSVVEFLFGGQVRNQTYCAISGGRSGLPGAYWVRPPGYGRK